MTLRALIPLISLVSVLVLSGLVIGLNAISLRKEARRDALFRLKDRMDKLESGFSRLDLHSDGIQVRRSIFQFSDWPAVECAWLLHQVSSSSAPMIEASLSRKDLHSEMGSSQLAKMDCHHLQPFIDRLEKEPLKKGVRTEFCNKHSKLFGGLRLSPERFVIVGVDLKKTLSSRENEIVFAASVLVGSFSAYFFLLFLFLNRQLYQRAMKLLTASHSLRLGDWSARSDLKGVDELGMLSESFDAMADQLQAQNKELSVLNDQLEIKVEERSREAGQLNEKLEASLKLREDVLSTITHEMKTPLTGMLTLTESVMDGSYGPLNQDQMDALQLAVDSSQQLNSLIVRFLDFANLQMGNVQIQKDWAPLQRICSRVLSRIERRYPKDVKRVSLDILNEDLIVYLDENRIAECVYYLIDNALKFTPAPGRVFVKAWKESDDLFFEVKDEGVGIDPLNLENIFEPLRQLDSNWQRKYSGVGLGLTLTREWIARHDGEVVVVSELNQGSCFTIKIPQTEPQPDLS